MCELARGSHLVVCGIAHPTRLLGHTGGIPTNTCIRMMLTCITANA